MQPYSLILAVILFISFKKNLLPSQLYIAIIFLLSVLVFLVSGFSFTSFRSLFNYTALFFISYSSFKTLKTGRFGFQIFLKTAIVIWFLVSLIQAIYNKHFLTFLVNSSRTTIDRGVTGLAPEPTFNGIIFLFFLLFLFHENFPKGKIFKLICIFSIVFLAKSAMALMLLLILYFYYILTHFKFKYLFFAVIGFLGFSFYSTQISSSSRIFSITMNLLQDPLSLLRLDASVNDRVFHVFFSIKGLFDNNLLPNGFLRWNDYAASQIYFYRDWVIIEWFSMGGRIMSGYGSAFFELGIFALLVPIASARLLYGIYRNDLRKFFLFFFFINTIMFAAIPLGFSLFAFYIGFLSFKNWTLKRSQFLLQ